MLAEDDPENPDRRRLGDVGGSHVLAGRLRTAGDQIDAQLGDGHRFFQSMSEMQQRVDAHQRVVVAAAGFFIERPEPDNAFRRSVGEQGGEKLFPIFRLLIADGEIVARGGEFRTTAHDPAACTGGGDLCGDIGSESGFVGENDPGILDRQLRHGSFGDGLAAFAAEDADLAFAFRALQTGHREGFGEADFLQCGFPLVALHQRLFRTQVAVGEMPPTLCEAENRLRPQLRRGHVHEHQGAARGEQIVEHFQRHPDIGHGVKHVGADDEIVTAGLEILIGARVFRDRAPCIPPRGKPRVSGSPPRRSRRKRR